jgi:hypothetical protein
MPRSTRTRPIENRDCTPPIVQASKSATILEMLQTADGASIEELCCATAWQQHSVRAKLSLLRSRGSHISRTGGDHGNRYRLATCDTESFVR